MKGGGGSSITSVHAAAPAETDDCFWWSRTFLGRPVSVVEPDLYSSSANCEPPKQATGRGCIGGRERGDLSPWKEHNSESEEQDVSAKIPCKARMPTSA